MCVSPRPEVLKLFTVRGLLNLKNNNHKPLHCSNQLKNYTLMWTVTFWLFIEDMEGFLYFLNFPPIEPTCVKTVIRLQLTLFIGIITLIMVKNLFQVCGPLISSDPSFKNSTFGRWCRLLQCCVEIKENPVLVFRSTPWTGALYGNRGVASNTWRHFSADQWVSWNEGAVQFSLVLNIDRIYIYTMSKPHTNI